MLDNNRLRDALRLAYEAGQRAEEHVGPLGAKRSKDQAIAWCATVAGVDAPAFLEPPGGVRRRLLEAKALKAINDDLHAVSSDAFAIGIADDRIRTILDEVRCPDVPERARRYDAVRTTREAGNPFWEDAVRKYPGRRSEILAIDRLIVEVAGEERVRRDTGVLPGWIVCGQKWAITTSLKCDPGDVAEAVAAVMRDNGYEPGQPTGLGPFPSRGRAA